MTTAITASHVFDGENDLGAVPVVISDGTIVSIGGPVPADAEVIDAPGATLLPGLIDAHVHTNTAGLRLALRFGVTTELEMQGANTARDRDHITTDDTVADVRSAGFALTAPGGHPDELFPADFHPGGHGPTTGGSAPGENAGHGGSSGSGASGGPVRPPRVDPIVDAHVTTPQEAVAVVRKLCKAGSDYIKFIVDDGSVEGHPGLPTLDEATLRAGVDEAHQLGMLTVAHALTVDAAHQCVAAGIDGLAHLFMDQPHTPDIINAIADASVFVVACLVLDASMMGITGESLANDPRVADKLPPEWDQTLRSSFNHHPQGNIADVLASALALHHAGVDILVGTDVSQPLPFLGGLAHGASVHHELQYLTRAGLTPLAALRAATSAPARRFGLHDRGQIAQGCRADLLLVDGNPLQTIDDTLNSRTVWRRGTPLHQPPLSQAPQQ